MPRHQCSFSNASGADAVEEIASHVPLPHSPGLAAEDHGEHMSAAGDGRGRGAPASRPLLWYVPSRRGQSGGCRRQGPPSLWMPTRTANQMPPRWRTWAAHVHRSVA